MSETFDSVAKGISSERPSSKLFENGIGDFSALADMSDQRKQKDAEYRVYLADQFANGKPGKERVEAMESIAAHLDYLPSRERKAAVEEIDKALEKHGCGILEIQRKENQVEIGFFADKRQVGNRWVHVHNSERNK